MECVLCGRRAMMYCESDQARLCCDCDEKVHGANFLVAKHHRSLLCYACQSPTPWTASGPKLTPTVSVCEGCVRSHRRKCDRGTDQESQGCNEVPDGCYEVSESEGDSEEEEDEDEDEDNEQEDEDGENQVVPWSHASSPPPAASSSSEGSFSGGQAKKTLKRKRETRDSSDSDDEVRSSSSQQGQETSGESSSPTFRSLKHFRPTIGADQPPTNQEIEDNRNLRPTDIMKSIKRLQTTMATDCNEASSGKTILGGSNFSRDQSN